MHLPASGLIEAFQYSPMILGPHEARDGRLTLGLSTRLMNIWAFHIKADRPFFEGMDPDSFPFQYGTFMVDMETLAIDATIMYGLSDKLDVVVRLPVFRVTGGFMDSIIEGFHDTFSINQHRRKEVARNATQIFIVDNLGNQHWSQESETGGWHRGNLVLGMGYRLRQRGPSLSVRCEAKLPTHNFRSQVLDGMDAYDASLIYSTAWAWGRTCWYHGGALTHHGNSDNDLVAFETWRFNSGSTFELKATNRFSYLLHFVVQSPYAHYPELAEYIFEGTFGVRFSFGRYRLDLGLIENLFQFDNSPDLGLLADLQYHL